MAYLAAIVFMQIRWSETQNFAWKPGLLDLSHLSYGKNVVPNFCPKMPLTCAFSRNGSDYIAVARALSAQSLLALSRSVAQLDLALSSSCRSVSLALSFRGYSIVGSGSGFTMNSNPKWIRLTLDTLKVIWFAKWIWTQIHCESWSGSDNRIACYELYACVQKIGSV